MDKIQEMNDLQNRVGFGSRLHAEKVLTLHNACPMTVPLIK